MGEDFNLNEKRSMGNHKYSGASFFLLFLFLFFFLSVTSTILGRIDFFLLLLLPSVRLYLFGTYPAAKLL